MNWCAATRRGRRPRLGGWFVRSVGVPDLSDLPGIDQRFDLVAANAVDLVVSQLITNERGVPPVHRVTLFPGQWMDGPGAPASVPV
jgi:hypothetical protein